MNCLWPPWPERGYVCGSIPLWQVCNKKRDCPAVYYMLDTAVIGSFSTKGMMTLLVSHCSADSIEICVCTIQISHHLIATTLYPCKHLHCLIMRLDVMTRFRIITAYILYQISNEGELILLKWSSNTPFNTTLFHIMKNFRNWPTIGCSIEMKYPCTFHANIFHLFGSMFNYSEWINWVKQKCWVWLLEKLRLKFDLLPFPC